MIRHITHDLSVFTNDWMTLKEGKFGRNMRVYNAWKYNKLYIELYLKFLLDNVV